MLNDNIYGPLIDLMLENEDLKELVGDRMWYGNRPQDESLPAVRLLTIGVIPTASKTEVSTVDIVMVGMDVYAKDPNMAFTICRLIRDTVDGLVNKQHKDTIFQGIRFIEWEDDADEGDRSDVYAIYNSYEVRIVRIDPIINN